MLSVVDVHVAYGRTPALTGPSLTVAAGEIVSIIGRNGVGKTTLLKTIIGLLRVTSGSIHLDGRDVTRAPAHERARRGLGYVRSEEHTSELQSRFDLVCRLLLEKKKLLLPG